MKAFGRSVPLRAAVVKPRPLVVVSAGAERRMNTRRLGEIGSDISRSQDRKKRNRSKHGSNPDTSLTPTPEMLLKRHLTHLLSSDGSRTILVAPFLRSSTSVSGNGVKTAFPLWFATKTAAWNAAQVFRAKLSQPQQTGAPTVAALVEQYPSEKMPARLDTHRGYESWIRVHILPKWGQKSITDLQARPVEVWLGSLALSPKSRVHIRGILSSLWKFAMWKQDVPLQVNPMSLVGVKGASKRIRQPQFNG